jgi:hypothetical protein
VDLLGRELLARPALAVDEHRRLGARDLEDERARLLHPRRAPDERPRRAQALDGLAEGAHLAEQAPVLRGATREEEELVGIDRLLEEVVGAGLHRAHGLGDGADARDHDDRDLDPVLPRVLEEHERVAFRHPQVRDDDVDALLRQEVDGLAGPRGGVRAPTVRAEDLHDRVAHEGLIVDDEDARRVHARRLSSAAGIRSAAAAGRRIENTAPPSSRFLAAIVPPCAFTIP